MNKLLLARGSSNSFGFRNRPYPCLALKSSAPIGQLIHTAGRGDAGVWATKAGNLLADPQPDIACHSLLSVHLCELTTGDDGILILGGWAGI